MMSSPDPEIVDWHTVYNFWFPLGLDEADFDEHRRMGDWWMQGGANSMLAPFRDAVTAARSGRLDNWLVDARGRLSLILILDQLSRGLFAGTPEAFASDREALRVAEEGLRNGQFDALDKPWERLFFLLPLIHTEGPNHGERIVRNIAIAEGTMGDVPPRLLPFYQFSLEQTRAHLDVISRFGRFPHRNAILGRLSTPEETTYMATERPVHTRRIPAAR